MRPGDLVMALGGEPVRSAQDLVSRVAALTPGAQRGTRGPPRAAEPYKINLTCWNVRPSRQ